MQYLKPITVTLLTALLLLALTSDVSGGESFAPGFDTNAAMRAHSPDAIMMSGGGIDATWGEFYFLLHNIISQVTYGFSEELDWDELSPTGETWEETIMSYVLGQTEQILIYRYGVETSGISLSDEEIAEINSYIDELLSGADSDVDFEKELQLDGFINLDVFRKLIFDDALQAKLPAELYGPFYDEIDDETVADFAEREGYMLAKHILLQFPASEYDESLPDGGNNEAGKAAQLEKAQELMREINARKNDADFFEFFSELVNEHSEDPGSFSFPDGYLFLAYEMVPEFSDACLQLKPGEVSGIVETAYGYHILLRLPLNFDMVPYGFMSQGQYYSLRQLAVFEDFDNRILEWSEALDITRSRALENLDVRKLFRWRG